MRVNQAYLNKMFPFWKAYYDENKVVQFRSKTKPETGWSNAWAGCAWEDGYEYRIKPDPVVLYCVWWQSVDGTWLLNDYRTQEQANAAAAALNHAHIQIITKPEEFE